MDAATFSFLELSVGVIAVCLPTLRPLLVAAMPRVFGSLLHSGSGTGRTGGARGTGAGAGAAGSAGLSYRRSGYAGLGGGRSGAGASLASAARRSHHFHPCVGGGNCSGKGCCGATTTTTTATTATLRESDSTEGLRVADTPRSRGADHDIEFGELQLEPGGGTGRQRRYSVSVVAGGGGWESDSWFHPDGAVGEAKSGIKTTTVVTQKVTFAGIEEEESDGSITGPKQTDKDGL